MSCLDKVIKLSRTECPCYTESEDFPADINEGQAEVYLDELEGLNLDSINGGADCSKGNVWEMMDRARDNASKALKADLLSCMESNYVAKRPNYSGFVGETQANSTLTFSQTRAGMLWLPHKVIGGKAKIKRIGVFMNAVAAVSVSIYDNDQNYNTPLATYTINSAVNTPQYAVLSPALEVPLWKQNGDKIEYYFVYTISGFMPRNNKSQCIPCSGGVKDVAWNNWLQVYGIRGNGNDFKNFSRTSELNGLIIDAEFMCNAGRAICSDEYPLDFENSGRAMQIAYAIRFKAGAILIDNILSSPEINRYTMLDREALYGKRNHYRSKYEQWIQYLCENTEAINNDCWACKPNALIRIGAMLT